MKIIECTFDTNTDQRQTTKRYNYFCHDDSVKVGDVAVVKTPFGISTVNVVSVDDTTNPKAAIKYIVDLVDFSAHNKREEERKARDIAIAKLDELLKQKQQEDKYSRLRDNPQAKELLDLLGL